MQGHVNSTAGAVHYVLGYVLPLLWGENTILFIYLFFFPLLPQQEKHLILTEQELQDSRAISTSCTWEYSLLCTHSHRSLHPAVAQTAPRGNAEPLSANQTLITAGWASSPPSTSLYMQDTSVAITDPIRTGADTTMDFFFPSNIHLQFSDWLYFSYRPAILGWFRECFAFKILTDQNISNFLLLLFLLKGHLNGSKHQEGDEPQLEDCFPDESTPLSAIMDLNPNISPCRRGQTIAKGAQIFVLPSSCWNYFTFYKHISWTIHWILFVKASEGLFLALFNSYVVALFKIKTLIGQKKSEWSWTCAFPHRGTQSLRQQVIQSLPHFLPFLFRMKHAIRETGKGSQARWLGYSLGDEINPAPISISFPRWERSLAEWSQTPTDTRWPA